MRPFQSTTDPQVASFPEQVSRWPLALRQLHQRIAAYFARPEPRRHALLYLQAILSDIPRKNGWQIAEHVRQARPYGMQRLLSHAVWDQDGVRDELRAFVCQSLRAPLPQQQEDEALFPVLVMDESGFPKRGRHSAGVGPQYCGLTGRVENCQVGVFLSYVTARGHALIDRELYLPEDWCSDLPRRQAAHIPDHVPFATKPELGRRMIQRAQEAHLPIRWVVADTVYGHSPDLRLFLEEQGCAYAMAIPSIEVVCVQTKAGYLLSDVADIAIGSASVQARAPKGRGSLIGLDCRCWIVVHPTVAIGSSFAAASTSRTSWPITWSLPHRPLPSPSWCRLLAPAGASKKTWKRAKTWDWITMKCAATSAGIATSRWSCSPLPSWSASVCKSALLFLLQQRLLKSRSSL